MIAKKLEECKIEPIEPLENQSSVKKPMVGGVYAFNTNDKTQKPLAVDFYKNGIKTEISYDEFVGFVVDKLSSLPKEYDCVYVEILPKECLNVVYYNRSGDDNKFMRNYNDLGELSFFFW